jgi:hypothetical protein
MTALYDVTSDDGSTGILATSDEQEFAVSEVIDAPPTPLISAGSSSTGTSSTTSSHHPE